MKYTLLLAAFLLIGCGGGGTKLSPGSNTGNANGSGGGSGANPADPCQQAQTLQAGQWEFTFPSANQNVPPAYLETNLQVTDQEVSASQANVEGYAPYYQASAWQSTGQGVGVFPGGYLSGVTSRQADNYVLEGSTQAGVSLNIQDTDIDALVSTLVAPVGSSSLTGAFNLVAPGPITPWAFEGGFGTGAFTATAIQPINGSFTGSLQTSTGGTDQVAFSITQSVLQASLRGTSSTNGNSATLVIEGSDTSIVGALLSASGTYTNANATQQFSINAHIHPDGKQIDIVLVQNDTQIVEWGTIKAGN